MLDGADQLWEFALKRHSLLSLLKVGYIDQEILDLFETGDEGWFLAVLPGPERN